MHFIYQMVIFFDMTYKLINMFKRLMFMQPWCHRLCTVFIKLKKLEITEKFSVPLGKN